MFDEDVYYVMIPCKNRMPRHAVKFIKWFVGRCDLVRESIGNRFTSLYIVINLAVEHISGVPCSYRYNILKSTQRGNKIPTRYGATRTWLHIYSVGNKYN